MKQKRRLEVKRLAVKKKPLKITPSKVTDWVALELTPRGEAEQDIASIINLIKKSLHDPKAEIFVPIYYENEEYFEKNISLLSGYYFIRFDVAHPYSKLKDTKYFEGVVCDPASSCPQLIPNSDVEKLKDKFNDLILESSEVKIGQTVKILDGLYKNLNGEIIRIVMKDNLCIIKITSLISRNITVSAPLMSCKVVEDVNDKSDIVTFFGE